METTQAYLPIQDSKIYYETTGQGEPLLLLHGGFGTNEDFTHQTAELAKHFKVYAFERPGHGHTADIPGPFSFDSMTKYTTDFIETLKLGSAHLVGWSDGAIVALLVAISRPDLVLRVVSVGGSFNPNSLTPSAIEWLRKATPEDFQKVEPALIERYDLVSPDGSSHFPTIFEKTKRLWLEEPNIQPDELARITVPVLVMAGDRDAVTTEHTLQLFNSIKNPELCIIPGTTHFLLSEKPDAANRAILEFLLANKPGNPSESRLV